MDDYSSVIYRNNHRAVRLPSTPHEVEITKNLTDEEHEALQVVDVYKKTRLLPSPLTSVVYKTTL